jgi:hypothetical protein
MKKNSTPEAMLRNTLGRQTPEQRQKLYSFAKRFGYSDEQINQIEKFITGINT